MSRPESELQPRFDVVKEEATAPGLIAVPLTLRKQTLAEFDREFRLDIQKERESQMGARTTQVPEVTEALANSQLLMKQGEFQLAKNLFRSVLRYDSSHEFAIRGVAECASRMGQHEEAIQVLKKLVEKHKTTENFRILADEFYALEYFEDAFGAYMQALTAGPVEAENLFHVYKNMGNIQLRLGDVGGAEECYNKAYTIHPESDVLLVNFGSLAIYRGEYDKALARFREAVRLNDMNEKAWVGLAMIHREYGDAELAWANVEKALDIAPGLESAIKLVAEWAMKDNEIEKAVARLDRYLKIHDQDAFMSMWLAKFLYFSGRYDQALVEIEKALYLEPNLPDAMEVAAVVKAELNKRNT